MTDARAVYLDIPGSFVRGRYIGPDPLYRRHYNGEVWDEQAGDWVDVDDLLAPVVPLVRALGEPEARQAGR